MKGHKIKYEVLAVAKREVMGNPKDGDSEKEKEKSVTSRGDGVVIREET